MARMFKDRETADKWIRTRLAVQVQDYDILIEQLKEDLLANTKAMQAGSSSELLRNRNSIMTTLRTLMAGQQELMIALVKARELMSDLGSDNAGGDVTVVVGRPPPLPPAVTVPEAVGDGSAGSQ